MSIPGFHRDLDVALSNEEGIDVSRVGDHHVSRLPDEVRRRCEQVHEGLCKMGVKDDLELRLKRAAKLNLQVGDADV